MKYACNEEGVAALHEGQKNIEAGLEALKTKTTDLADTISAYNAIGPHKDKIISALNGVSDTLKQATTPIYDAAFMLGELADSYQEFIDEQFSGCDLDDYSGSGSSPSSGIGNSQSGSCGGIVDAVKNILNIPGKYNLMSDQAGLWQISGIPDSISKIQTSHNYADDCFKVNPQYHQYKTAAWHENCQRCTVAYELRRRGYDVKAQPRPTTIVTDRVGNELEVAKPDHLATYPFDAWIPPESIYCDKGIDTVKECMSNWGDGARCEIAVIWNGSNSGHVFVAEQVDGVTMFMDPQSGEIGIPVEEYFLRADKKNIYVCRTDNKNMSNLVNQCYY